MGSGPETEEPEELATGKLLNVLNGSGQDATREELINIIGQIAKTRPLEPLGSYFEFKTDPEGAEIDEPEERDAEMVTMNAYKNICDSLREAMAERDEMRKELQEVNLAFSQLNRDFAVHMAECQGSDEEDRQGKRCL